MLRPLPGANAQECIGGSLPSLRLEVTKSQHPGHGIDDVMVCGKGLYAYSVTNIPSPASLHPRLLTESLRRRSLHDERLGLPPPEALSFVIVFFCLCYCVG